MKELAGKVAVVTGAASGIGRALAEDLARRRMDLSICDVDESGLEQTLARCEGTGVKVLAEKVDVADRGAMHAWADRCAELHGRINLVINNAGVALGSNIEEMSYEDLEWLMGINFWGVVHGTKAFLPHLIASGDGHIVNVSSVFGIIAVPTQSAYNAAKFAVRGFTECLREELEVAGHPVSATSVHPGGIKTSIVANSRLSATSGFDDRQEAIRSFERAARTTSERAASIIIEGVLKNRRRVLVGGDARIIDFIQRLLPSSYQRILVAATRRQGQML